MNYIYILLSVFIFIRVFFRRPDFLSLAAVSFMMYTSYCILGEVWIEGGVMGYYYKSDISSMTYMVIFLQMIIIYLSLNYDFKYLTKNYKVRKKNKNKDSSLFWILLLIFSICGYFYGICIEIGIDAFFSFEKKTEIGSQLGPVFAFAVWGSLLSFAHAVMVKNRLQMTISVVLILFTVLLGSRAYIVTALVVAVILNSNGRFDIKNNIKLLMGGFIVVFALLIYKNIYVVIRALDFETALFILQDPYIYSQLTDVAEFRINLALYNYFVSTGWELSYSEVIARIISVIPFLNSVLADEVTIRTSVLIKDEIAPNGTYGFANSFWGECFSMGGVFLLAFITATWSTLIKKASDYLRNGFTSNTPFVAVVGSYCSFYIHRLDWVLVFGCIKSVVAFYLLFLIINKALPSIMKKNYNPTSELRRME